MRAELHVAITAGIREMGKKESARSLAIGNYFRDKAEAYDDVDQQDYWRLSDALLWDTFNRELLSNVNPSLRFLDAGGGTGRWSSRVAEEYPGSSGVLYDLSEDMADQARAKEIRGVNIQIGDIEEGVGLPDGEFDVSFNFHNVMGFVSNPFKALATLNRVTKLGGYVVSLVPNKFHAMYFNITNGNLDLAEEAATTPRGRFTDNMPSMNLFTPDSIGEMYGHEGLKVTCVTGFPSSIYPGYQETQLHGSTANLKGLLEDEDSFQRVFEMEKRLIQSEGIASRGNNIFIVGRKIE